MTDATGATYPLCYSLPLGMGLSLLIGLFSSVAGIGGGVIHVPVMTSLLGFPVHIATATSQFVLIFTSLAGVADAPRRTARSPPSCPGSPCSPRAW